MSYDLFEKILTKSSLFSLHSNDLVDGPPDTSLTSFIEDAITLGLSKKLLSFKVIKSFVDLMRYGVSKLDDSGEFIPVLLTLGIKSQSLNVRDGIIVCNTS